MLDTSKRAKRIGIWLLFGPFGPPLTNGCVGSPPQPPGQDETATTNDGDVGTTVVGTSGATTGLASSSADGTGSTGTADSGSGSAEVTTDPGATTTDGGTTGSTGTTDAGSSGGPAGPSYPECMDDARCPDSYELCWPPFEFGDPNFCTIECVDAGDCPTPTSGAATPVCEGPPGTYVCILDCGRGECPDGMACVDVFGNGDILRCLWP